MNSEIKQVEPLHNGYFHSDIEYIMAVKPEANAAVHREHLETVIALPTQERPQAIHQVDPPANPKAPSPRITGKEASAPKLTPPEISIGEKLAQEFKYYSHEKRVGDRHYDPSYYENLEASISELHKLKAEDQAYITGDDSIEKPKSYLHIIEKIQTPMPFQIFAESHPPSISNPRVNNPADDYLRFETSVLNKIRNVPTSSSPNPLGQEVESYELHQQRIINTLKTINQSELNLRLAFINLYLQASKSRINQETAPIEKEALLSKTVKFLNTNLISPRQNSFPSEDKADKYAKSLSTTITHIKDLQSNFSLNADSNSQFKDNDQINLNINLLKRSVAATILEQSEGLITVKNLKPTAKWELLANNDLKSILEENRITELNNKMFKNLLDQPNFSSLQSSNGSTDPEQAKKAARQEMFNFIQKHDPDYNQEDLFSLILKNLQESKNDRIFFFKFLNQMIDKTPEIFTQFQNNEITNDNQNQFREFKNSLLDHLKQPSDETSGLPLVHVDMGESLVKLMRFKDSDIKQAAKVFYLQAIKEAQYISCINNLLEPLHSTQTAKEASIYDSVPLTAEDLTEHLQNNQTMIQMIKESLERSLLGVEKKSLTNKQNPVSQKAILQSHAAKLGINTGNII
jgi:hypothetical protein